MVGLKQGLVLIVEGGGHQDSLKVECRRAFSQLLERAGLRGRMPRIIAGGSRQSAYEQFVRACEEARSGGPLPMLLVDSEGPITAPSPWRHVAMREGDGWTPPETAGDDHLHLMVECMEAWFFADRAAMQAFFGKHFKENALPASTTKIENVSKKDIFDALARATEQTKKGSYGKGPHSFKLLATVDPAKVRRASAWAERFFAAIDRLATHG